MMPLPLLPLLLFSSFLVATSVTDNSCEFPIRRGRVLSSWQSSDFDGQLCFHNKSSYSENADLNSVRFSFRFFHSSNSSQADGGFHWFGVQLNESVLIKSVTVKGREDGARYIYPRAEGIEIWVSDSSREIFSGDHCRSSNINRQFEESRLLWRRCGTTQRKHQEILAGENFTVECTASVRQLLLRKDVTRADPNTYLDFMSFADLRLQRLQLMISSDQVVAVNSSFIVFCEQLCNSSQLLSNSSGLQLCLPNGTCLTEHKIAVSRALPQHSGKYTCRLGSVKNHTSVTVLYPPSGVSISFTNSCRRKSNQQVWFRSSASSPVPEHRCSAYSDGVRKKQLRLISQQSDKEGAVSLWSLAEFDVPREELSSVLSIACTATQTLPIGVPFEPVRSARAQLSCSPTSWLAEVTDGLKYFASGFGSGFVTAVVMACVFCRVAAARGSQTAQFCWGQPREDSRRRAAEKIGMAGRDRRTTLVDGLTARTVAVSNAHTEEFLYE